jgi:hypothetical protein
MMATLSDYNFGEALNPSPFINLSQTMTMTRSDSLALIAVATECAIILAAIISSTEPAAHRGNGSSVPTLERCHFSNGVRPFFCQSEAAHDGE